MTEGHITTVDGCRIFWRMDGPETGAENAPVLILSNSLGASMDMWQAQLSAWSATHRVLRYDTRGHGGSDVPAGPYSMDRLGRDVLDLMDALGIETAAFCGLSLGGMTGQWLGVHAPDRFSQLILLNTSAYMGPPSGWQDRIGLVLKDGTQAIADAVLARWFTPAFMEANPDTLARARTMFCATNGTGYAGCCAAIRDMDQRNPITVIPNRTLVVGGTQDQATPPEHSELLHDRIAGSKLVFFPSAHLSTMETEQEITDAVAAFLADG